MDLQTIIRLSNDLIGQGYERDQAFKELERMFFMDDEVTEAASNRMEGGKLTLSPSPRNQILGATRLLFATDPQFNAPRDENEMSDIDTLDAIEVFANNMFSAAGRISGSPLHYDYILSAMLYGEAHIAVKPTKKLAAMANNPAAKARAAKALSRTPYLFEVYNPRECYYTVDILGVTSHFRRITTTAGTIISTYGEKALPSQYRNANLQTAIVLNEWWDLEYHALWIDGQAEAIELGKHGLPFIPISVQIAEGSWQLFNRTEVQGQPFLYAVDKSGVWKRENLLLTSIMTNVYNFGLNPQFVYKANAPGKNVHIDWATPGGVFVLENNENLEPMNNTNLISPHIMQALEVVNNLTTESTIYKQVLGEPLGDNAAYSMVSLLSQAGRLPLVSPQTRLGWGLAKALEIALLWAKMDDGEINTKYKGVKTKLNVKEIPDDLELECKLEVSLPQDNLQNANVAAALTDGPDPMVSKAWARENILRIGQPGEMLREIWGEQAAKVFAEQWMTEQMLKLQQARTQMEQLMQQRAMQEQAPPQEGPPPPAEAGPPAMGMQQPGDMQEPNIPLQQGIPPQLAGPRQPAPAGQPPAGPPQEGQL